MTHRTQKMALVKSSETAENVESTLISALIINYAS